MSPTTITLAPDDLARRSMMACATQEAHPSKRSRDRKPRVDEGGRRQFLEQMEGRATLKLAATEGFQNREFLHPLGSRLLEYTRRGQESRAGLLEAWCAYAHSPDMIQLAVGPIDPLQKADVSNG